jgi:hypothetical protein
MVSKAVIQATKNTQLLKQLKSKIDYRTYNKFINKINISNRIDTQLKIFKDLKLIRRLEGAKITTKTLKEFRTLPKVDINDINNFIQEIEKRAEENEKIFKEKEEIRQARKELRKHRKINSSQNFNRYNQGVKLGQHKILFDLKDEISVRFLNDLEEFNKLKEDDEKEFIYLTDEIYKAGLILNDYDILNINFQMAFDGVGSINIQTHPNKNYENENRTINRFIDIRKIMKGDTETEQEVLKEGHEIIIQSNGNKFISGISKAIIKSYIKKIYSDLAYKGYGIIPLFVGFTFYPDYKNIQLTKEQRDNDFNNYISRLRAYAPAPSQDFHNMTKTSTTRKRLCIYETYYYLYKTKQNKTISKIINEINEAFNKESKEIKEIIKKGLLLEFLIKKSTILNEVFYVQFFKNFKKYDENDYLGFRVEKGIIYPIYDSEEEFINKDVFLYDAEHVAPRKNLNNEDYKKLFKKELKKDEDKQTQYKLSPTIKKNFTKKDDPTIIGFDFETFKDENNNAVPFCLNLSNKVCFYLNDTKNKHYKNIDNKKIEVINTNNIIKSFIDYLDENYLIETDYTKTHKKEELKYYKFYGFNNSRFDNILFYTELFKHDTTTTANITGTDIKYIKYHNISFYDLNLYYTGSLSSTSKEFKLNIKKGAFPVLFPKIDNLNYIGEIPERKYFKDNEDYEECKALTGSNIYNLKDECIKYCFYDALLCEEMAILHLKSCKGEINGRKYDVRDKITGAGMAITMFNQVYQNDVLYSSPENIQKLEKKAYKGGRTEVFKKRNEENTQLYYYDINSSYPASMMKKQPVKYIKTVRDLDIKINMNNIERLVETNLYKCNVKYTGNDNYYIPNLLTRTEKGEVIATKNLNSGYHWGVELIEAIKNNNEIIVDEENVYQSDYIFNQYVDYFYGERKKIKSINPSKAQFYKLLLNSLYGKFGQMVKPKTELIKDEYRLRKLRHNKNIMIVDEVLLNNGLLKVDYYCDDDEILNIGCLVRFSSYIASCSRTKLSEFMRVIGHKNIYYCDTDSIQTDKNMKGHEMIDDKILGKWKLEDEIKEAKFMAPKTYYYKNDKGEETFKSKGNPTKYLTKDNFYKTKEDEEKNIIINPSFFKRSLLGVKIIEQGRTMKEVLKKRIFKSDFHSEAFETVEDYLNNLKK